MVNSTSFSLRRAAVLVLLAAGAFAAWRLAREAPDDAERVAAAIDAMRAAAEARKVPGVMRHVADSYRDTAGGAREELRALLLYHLLGAQDVGVTVLRQRVSIDGAAAVAELDLLLSRDGRRDTRHLLLRFAKTDDEWKLVASDHGESVPSN